MQLARDQLRELTRRSRTPLPVKWIVEDMNRFLRGWAAYFRFGNSTARFHKIRSYALMQLALFLSKKHRRRRGFGWSVVTYRSLDQLGLVILSGIVVDPIGLARQSRGEDPHPLGPAGQLAWPTHPDQPGACPVPAITPSRPVEPPATQPDSRATVTAWP